MTPDEIYSLTLLTLGIGATFGAAFVSLLWIGATMITAERHRREVHEAFEHGWQLAKDVDECFETAEIIPFPRGAA